MTRRLGLDHHRTLGGSCVLCVQDLIFLLELFSACLFSAFVSFGCTAELSFEPIRRCRPAISASYLGTLFIVLRISCCTEYGYKLPRHAFKSLTAYGAACRAAHRGFGVVHCSLGPGAYRMYIYLPKTTSHTEAPCIDTFRVGELLLGNWDSGHCYG